MPDEATHRKRGEDLLLLEAKALRDEALYKMQLVHRVSLSILTAPVAVLPVLARLAVELFPKEGEKVPLGEIAPIFDSVLVLVALGLPVILVWAELFCVSQTNGVLRVGAWLRHLEKGSGKGEAGGVTPGWESWLELPGRRTWDDVLLLRLRLSVVGLFFVAASVLAGLLLESYAERHGLIAGGVAGGLVRSFPFDLSFLIYSLFFLAFLVLRRKSVYRGEQGPPQCPELRQALRRHLRREAGQAVSRPEGQGSLVFLAASVPPRSGDDEGPAADPLRLLGESRRVLGVYEELYDWDALLAGAAFLGETGAQGTALEGALRLLLQREKDGFIPRTVSLQGTLPDPEELAKPLLAQGALAVARAKGSAGWLSVEHYASLQAFHRRWLERKGRHGMVCWLSSLESGVDNGAALVHFAPRSVESVDATVYLYRDLRALAVLADERGDGETAAASRREALSLALALERTAWSETDRFFWDRWEEADLPIRIRAWGGLLPLWAGFLKPEMARLLVHEVLLAPDHFWSPHGVRSLSASEPAYSTARRAYVWDHVKGRRGEVSNWQGPVWVLSSVLLADALVHHGFLEPAETLCRRTLGLLEADLAATGTLHECYHPETGEGLWSPGFLSWNGLALCLDRWLRERPPHLLPAGFTTAVDP